jgi:hypothetical protein
MAFPGEIFTLFFSQSVEAAGFGELRIEPGQPCERLFTIEVTLIVLKKA